MDITYYAKDKPKSRKKLLIIFSFLGVLFMLTFFLTSSIFIRPPSSKILGKEIAPTAIIPSPTPTIDHPSPNELLEKIVLGELAGTRGSYSIAIKNLKTGVSYFFNEHKSYDSASLYKLWIMAETYNQIKSGGLKEDQVLSEDVKTLNERHKISSKSAGLQEGTITQSINEALNKMITASDNYAALLLSAKIRLAKVTSFLKANGFKESTIGTVGGVPQATAHDIALFFEKLYNSELIDEEYSEKMLQLLKGQRLNNKIPKLLPDNIVVAHKTGELDPFTHDGGIVYAQNGDYIIVVLSESDNPDAAENRIADVSEAVFNYFQNK